MGDQGFPGDTVGDSPLAVQGTRTQAVVWEDSTCCGAPRPRATTTEAPVPRVCVLQQEKAISHAHSHEKPAPQLGNSPCWPQLEKAHAAVETQRSHK